MISLTGHVILALSDDTDSSYLVKESEELEEWFGLTFTDIILSGSLGSIREMKKEMLALDKKKCADRCLEKACRCVEMDWLVLALGYSSAFWMEDSERPAAAE